jgi:hypothetical protein
MGSIIREPRELYLQITGWGPKFVRWVPDLHRLVWGKGVFYRCRDGELSLHDGARCPSADEWTEFWTTVDQIGVWDWRKYYKALDIFDGVSWRLMINHGDHSLGSAGDGSLSPPLWLWFLRAVGSLVSDERFQLSEWPWITHISGVPDIIKDAADVAAPRTNWTGWLAPHTDFMLHHRYEAGIELFGSDSQGRGSLCVAVTHEGKVMGIRRTVPAGEVPEAVGAALKARLPGFEPMQFQTVGPVDGPAVYYEVTGSGADGRTKRVNIGADGKIITEQWPGFGCYKFGLPYP